jgi:diguanylate cyclase (GGDEF)-like protein
VLCAAADRLRGVSRSQVDWVVRLGGEEFLVVLPETDEAAARHTAERLRYLLASEPVRFDEQLIPMTASFGVAQVQPGEDGNALVKRADALLYQAKAAGRNRVFPAL